MHALPPAVSELERDKWSSHCARTKIARHDGLVSVARGFRKKDLEDLSQEIPVTKHQINWKWAFRYQWLLVK